MGAANHSLAFPDVVCQRIVGAVIHHRGKAQAQALHSLLIANAVIQVEHYGHCAFPGDPLDQIGQMLQLSCLDGSLTHGQDHRAMLLFRSIHDGLGSLNVINVKSRNRSVALHCDGKDFL